MSDSDIRLRPLRREDSELLYKWINDRDLRLYNAPYYPVTDYEHEQWMESTLKGMVDNVLFVMEHIEDDRPIGTFQLKNIHWVHRRAELQGRIGEREYWGKGYGTEAFSEMVRFAFDDLNLHRVQARVMGSNVRSLESLKKVGFTEEGRWKDGMYIDGEYVDVVWVSIIND